jgi:hypothetical protein
MQLLTFIIALFIAISDDGLLVDKPGLRRLVDGVESGFRHFLDWRTGADIQDELQRLSRLFGRLTLAMLAGFAFSRYCHAEAMATDFAVACMYFGFAWSSFRWTFQHREFIAPFAFWFVYALSIPWLVWGLDLAAGADALGELSAVLPWEWARTAPPAAIAAGMSAVIALIGGIGYALYWLMFFPFPYLVLMLLKLSRSLSALFLRYCSRSLLASLICCLSFVKEAYDFWKG